MTIASLVLVVAVVAASALAAGRLGRVPELRAVDAGADAIRRADGALLAAFEGDGRAWPRWVRPLTLRPASPPLRLRDEFVSDFALSPDGGTLALGSGTLSRIEFVDLRAPHPRDRARHGQDRASAALPRAAAPRPAPVTDALARVPMTRRGG